MSCFTCFAFLKEPFQHIASGCHTATDFVFTSLQGFKKRLVIWEGAVLQKAPLFCPQKCSASHSALTITWHLVPLCLVLESGVLQNKLEALRMLQGGCVFHPLPCCMPAARVQNPPESSTAEETCARAIPCDQPASDWCFPHRKNYAICSLTDQELQESISPEGESAEARPCMGFCPYLFDKETLSFL